MYFHTTDRKDGGGKWPDTICHISLIPSPDDLIEKAVKENDLIGNKVETRHINKAKSTGNICEFWLQQQHIQQPKSWGIEKVNIEIQVYFLLWFI